MKAIRTALFPILVLLCGITSFCATERGGGEYHWGRDAGYFDEISGFRRRFVAGIWYVEIREPGGSITARLDRALAPGTYRVMHKSFSPSAGRNVIRVELNGTVATITDERKAGSPGYLSTDITTTREGDRVSFTAQAVGKTYLRIYSVWITTNLRDSGTWNRLTLGPDPQAEPEVAESPGNLFPASSFEVGINDVWGKQVHGHVFINDNHLRAVPGAPHGQTVLSLPWHPETAGKRRYTTGLCSRPVRVGRGGKFTVSIFARASVPQAIRYGVRAGWDPVEKRPDFVVDAQLTTEWHRHAHTFELPLDFAGTLQFRLNATAGFDTPTSGMDELPTILLDAVQFERGNLTEYRPAYPSAAGVRIVGRPGSLFLTGEQVELDLAASGPSGNVDLAIVDHDLTPLHRETIRVETKSGFGSRKLQLRLTRRGPMMAVVQSVADRAAPPLRKAFSILDGLADDVPLDALRAGVYGEISKESVQSMYRAGFRFTNTLSVNHSLNKMSAIAPKRDEYVWDDGLVKMARNAGIEVVMCLSKYYPKWAQVAGKTYPTVEAWREFVSKVTAHYRGQVRYWMMVDEPSGGSGGRIPPAHYQRMVAAGYEAAHQADAGNRVLMHGDLPKFFGKVIASAGGRHDFYDILAGGANNWQNAAPQVEAARREGKGVWAITFCGKASLYDGRPTSSSAARLPKWFVERLSLLRTTKFMNYTARVSGPEPGAYATSMSMYEFDGAFRPAGLTYAVAGNLLAGTDPLGPLTVAEGVDCHLFGTGDKTVAVLWTDGRVLSCRLPEAEGMRCLDMTGTPQPPWDEVDEHVFILDSRPFYLVGGPALAATLKQMQTDPVVRVQTEVRGSSKEGQGMLTILIRNEMEEPFEGRAALTLRGVWFCLMGNRRQLARTRSLHIAPGAAAKIELPCLIHKVHPLRGYRLGLSLSCKQFTTELRDLPVEQ